MNFYDMLFGTLSADFCNLFFVLMLVALFFIGINIMGLIFAARKNIKLFPLFVSNLITGLFMYFHSRILYSMCLASLR